jgi:CDP-diacylglycerol--glycerol-3-phosphate 3-phosphatidyltransferase/cardiolipin synthase
MLSLPNLLTLSRIIAVPVLIALLWRPDPLLYGLAFGLYALVGITDYFDGYLARRMGTVSKLGAFLDPIADKFMVAAVLLMLVAVQLIDGIHIIAAIAILLRELLVSGLREYLAGSQVSVPVSKLAKWKTTFQMVAQGRADPGGGGAGLAVDAVAWARQPVACRGADGDHRGGAICASACGTCADVSKDLWRKGMLSPAPIMLPMLSGNKQHFAESGG